MYYGATFSAVTGKSAIHVCTCRHAIRKPGQTVTCIIADTAVEAAAKFDAEAELTARGYPAPVIHPCAGK